MSWSVASSLRDDTEASVISGDDLIRALAKFGYVQVRQKGSHIRLRDLSDAHRKSVTIPLHPSIAFGTLKQILRDARITVEQLLSKL